MRSDRKNDHPAGPDDVQGDASNKFHTILASEAIRFGYRLGYLANLFSGPIYKELSASHGISRPEWVVLFCLAHFDGLTAHEVGRMTGRAKANVSRAVHKLQQLDLLRREKNPADARSAILRLTEKGKRMHELTLPPFIEREAAMLSVLSPDDIQALDRLLERLSIRDDGWDAAY